MEPPYIETSIEGGFTARNEKHYSVNPRHNLTEMVHVFGEQTGMKLS